MQQVQILVEFNLIEVLVETLKANNEATIVKICLEALENILNIGKQTYQPGNEGNPYLVALAQYGGYQIIEALQGHPNNEVYKVVERLITHQMEYEV